jgi:Ca2+-binding EF-hand superfamily protein
MWVERYDENRDKRMQPSEAAAWLGRDAGRSLRPLALRSRRSYLAIPSLNSRAWQLLDANGDEVLVDTEIANAPHRLWLLDADDDRIVTLPELATLRDQLGLTATPMASPTFAENRPAAIHLDQETEVDRLNYRLADLYAPRQNLGPASFPGLPGLFESLDADGNDWLSGPELALLLTIEPHLELLVTFAEVGSLGLPPASLRVEGHAPEIEISAEPAANRIVVSLGGSRLLLSAHDLAPSRSEDQSADRNSVRLMVHDDCDALFEELDANADGRLGEREIATCSERLAALDDSQDGRIESDELAECMVVAFLRGEPAGNQSFYVPNLPVTSTTPASAVPPWFARADFNGDGDVSRREFVGTREQFSRLDTDGDGFINAAEAAAIPAKTN